MPESPLEEIRILIVEDSATDAELALHLLMRSGMSCDARRVETAAELRSVLSSFDPNVIISDFSMPTFDGLAALKMARELAPDVPFIFVSGQIGEDRAIDALHRGAVDYVLKNNLARLPPAVKRAVAEAAMRLQQQAQIARLNRVLRMLSGVNSAVARIRERTELLRETCRLAVVVGGYSGVVALAKVVGSALIQPVAWCGANEALAEALRSICADCDARADNIVGRAIKSGKTIVCNDMSGLDETRALSSPGDHAGLLSIVALPILVDNTAMGVLLLAAREAGAVGEEELSMLQEVAGNLSFAFQYMQKDTNVRFLSNFDPQTGLAKRSLFCERLARFLLDPGKRRSRYAVVVFDIERLGIINDSFGRRIGDLLLQHVAGRLKQHFPKAETVAHFGGGTFAVVGDFDTRTAEELLTGAHARATAIFREPFIIEQRGIPVAVRSGLALHPQDGVDAETLLQHAEAALLHAQTSGARQLHYSAERHSQLIGRLALEHKLRLALERREFELHYQPKVSVITRRIQGVEALIRWRDPEAGLVSPAAFLPLLESAGVAAEVGAWVIQQAALDCNHWLREGLPPVRVAVNLFPGQLQQPDFTPLFLRAVQDWSTLAWGLDIEVTEGALHEDCGAEVRKLELLRKSGVKVAIDDFGTGYSSLRRLSTLPIDALKIDSCFINQIPENAAGKAVIKTIMALARAFNMTTIAEGVENQDQLDFLWQIGCDQSQGYLHSKPIGRDEFALLLQHGNRQLILAAQPAEAAAGASAVALARSKR